jgi:hypothetical protein
LVYACLGKTENHFLSVWRTGGDLTLFHHVCVSFHFCFLSFKVEPLEPTLCVQKVAHLFIKVYVCVRAFHFKPSVSRPNIHISLCDDLFSLGIVSYLVRLYVIVPVIDLHILPCNKRAIGLTLQGLRKNLYAKGQTKAQQKQSKKHSKIIHIRFLKLFCEKTRGYGNLWDAPPFPSY